ncbi:glycosyl transferase [Pseudanabaena biceps]|nr:glycosyl transferase [Pseudanabaena biceps]
MKNTDSKTHVFTSCNNCYIPKARVLATSIKKFHPELQFHLILSDTLPAFVNIEDEPFDSIILIEELEIPNLKQWVFKHSVVETCTAVKGIAFQEIFKRYECDRIIFLDPDTAIFSPLDELLQQFEHGSILITPHQLEPEESEEAVVDNEICFLRHGVFNLGFLGVKNSPQGREFLNWWSKRCLDFCYDDTANGLFTDQRWIDLVPSFYDQVIILRNPAYNVANWNLTNRNLTGNLQEGVFVNGIPLSFYHFSSSQIIMQEKHKVINSVVSLLLDWYQQQCEQMGQSEFKSLPCHYNFFDNGELIPLQSRIRYRCDRDLQKYFPHPFDSSNLDRSYFHWYRQQESINQALDKSQKNPEYYRSIIASMETSKFWKMRKIWFGFKKFLGFNTED